MPAQDLCPNIEPGLQLLEASAQYPEFCRPAIRIELSKYPAKTFASAKTSTTCTACTASTGIVVNWLPSYVYPKSFINEHTYFQIESWLSHS